MRLRNQFVLSFVIFPFLFFLCSCAQYPNETALHKSIVNGNNESINKTISSTKNIDGYDKWGRTPLHIAVLQNKKEITSILISKGANINKRTLQGHTPLSLSVRHEDLEIANLFLNSGAEINVKNGRSTLIEAIKFRRINFCKKLIEMGADVNAFDRFNETPLYYTAFLNIPDLIPLLLSNGAKINSYTLYGMTPIQASAFTENKDIGRELLVRGAKVHPVEDNEKGLYSTAILYTILGEIYESVGRNDEALSAYNEAFKLYKIGELRFSEGASQQYFSSLKEGIGGLLSASLLTSYEKVSKNSNLKNFYDESTDYITSGLITFKEIHPEYFKSQNNQDNRVKGLRRGDDKEVSESEKLKSDIFNLYKNLSAKFANQSIHSSNQIKMLSDVASKNSHKDQTIMIPKFEEIGLVYDDEKDDFVDLIIYRNNRFYGSGASAHFFIDGCYYGQLMGNQYLVKKVAPGRHDISIAHLMFDLGYIKFADHKEIFIEKNTEEFFVEMTHRKKDTMNVVLKDIADKKMKNMKLVPLNNLKIYQ